MKHELLEYIYSLDGSVRTRDLLRAGPFVGKTKSELLRELERLESLGAGVRVYRDKTERFELASGIDEFIDRPDIDTVYELQNTKIAESIAKGGQDIAGLMVFGIAEKFGGDERRVYQRIVELVRRGSIKYLDGFNSLELFRFSGQERDDFGYVYAISPQHRSDVVKIGFTAREPEDRLKEIGQSGIEKYQLDGFMPASMSDEKMFHQTLSRAGLRVRGEWFKMNDLTRTLVDSMASFMPLAPYTLSNLERIQKAGL